MANDRPYRYLKLEGTRQSLNVTFLNNNILAADVIQGIGSELLRVVDLADSINMPLVIDFQGVDSISSALIGKLVVFHRKTVTHQVRYRFSNMSPVVKEVLSPHNR